MAILWWSQSGESDRTKNTMNPVVENAKINIPLYIKKEYVIRFYTLSQFRISIECALDIRE